MLQTRFLISLLKLSSTTHHQHGCSVSEKTGQVKSEVLKIKAERTKEYIQFEFKKAYMQLQLAYRML